MPIIVSIGVYLLSFLGIWYGAGLIVSSVDRFSRRLRLSVFSVSFIVLGLLTSIPELAIGLTALSEDNPDIFVGNLLGGLPILFLFIIPMLAVFGGGINLRSHLDTKGLFFTLLVIAAPSLLLADRRVTAWEAVVFIAVYGLLVMGVGMRHGFFDAKKAKTLNLKAYSYRDMGKVVVGIIIVFVTSHMIVDRTLFFSEFFSVSTFYMSLLLLSLGTNLPEFFIAIRSIILGKKAVAFGDYLGSAAANTLLFGGFTLLGGKEVRVVDNFSTLFIFIIAGLGLFFFFSRSKRFLSKREGLILLTMYVLFVLCTSLSKQF